MPTLTTRKVVRLGQNGFVISLPVGWVRYHNLKAGDRLEVIANRKLIVRPSGKSTSKYIGASGHLRQDSTED
jgi:bifunctional DNA-binding transcriptional regulator/antitoxin component of YhaV-PrlF toxin-antitoxin module